MITTVETGDAKAGPPAARSLRAQRGAAAAGPVSTTKELPEWLTTKNKEFCYTHHHNYIRTNNLTMQTKSQYPLLHLMRFHKPIGILLLLWPTLWALWIATNGQPPLKIVAIFITGVITMRAAGCIINDIADRKFDGLVERTKNRPLVTGEVSTKKALILFLILCLIALCLVLNLNFLTIKLSVVGLLLAIAYPFTKRFLPFPQFILGMAFNWSIPMAFAATTNTVPSIAWLLYGTTLLWTVVYDTQYAMVDQQDDIQIGIKSTAIWFGNKITFILDTLQVFILLGFAWIGWETQMTFPFWIALFIAGLLAVYQHTLVESKQPQACFKAFLNNNWYGAILFVGIAFSYLLR